MRAAAAVQKLQRGVQLFLRIAGQGQHHVARQVGKARLLCPKQRLAGLGGGVRAPHAAQAFIQGRLHAQGKAVCARGEKAAQQSGRQRLGVCLQRNLRPGAGLCRINQLCKLGRAQQAGRAAAEIQGVRCTRKLPAQAGQLAQKGVYIRLRHLCASAKGIKIAVAAFGKAVRNMEIDALHHGPPLCAALCGAGPAGLFEKHSTTNAPAAPEAFSLTQGAFQGKLILYVKTPFCAAGKEETGI